MRSRCCSFRLLLGRALLAVVGLIGCRRFLRRLSSPLSRSGSGSGSRCGGAVLGRSFRRRGAVAGLQAGGESAVRPASGRTCWIVVSCGRKYVLWLTHLPEQRCEGHWSVSVREGAAATARALCLCVVVFRARDFPDAQPRAAASEPARAAAACISANGVNTPSLSHA